MLANCVLANACWANGVLANGCAGQRCAGQCRGDRLESDEHGNSRTKDGDRPPGPPRMAQRPLVSSQPGARQARTSLTSRASLGTDLAGRGGQGKSPPGQPLGRGQRPEERLSAPPTASDGLWWACVALSFTSPGRHADDNMNKSRVEAFTDGVFAFAITLLVVTIAQPEDYRHLAHDLARRWPSLAAYVVSFAVIGIMWLNHHSVFGHFNRVDRGLVLPEPVPPHDSGLPAFPDGCTRPSAGPGARRTDCGSCLCGHDDRERIGMVRAVALRLS